MYSRFVRFIRINRLQQQWSVYITTGLRKEFNRKINYKVFVPSIPVNIAALWGLSKNKDDDKSLASKELIIAKADALFDQGEYKEIYKLLNTYKDKDDIEILWRLSRALYKISLLESNEAEAKKLVYEAYDLISKACALQDDHWAVNKWMAILLNTKTSYEGNKIKIKELYNIKKYMLRASELNPKDATTLYMIGSWCYQIADMAWYQRKIASAIFGEPPTSTFDEALHYFEQAERVDPSFYGQNLLMLGKTYLKLNKKEDAIKYLKMASEYPAKTDDDQEAKQEAAKILRNLL